MDSSGTSMGSPRQTAHSPGGWPCPAPLNHRCSTPLRDLFANLSTPSFPAASDALLLAYVTLLGSAASYGVFYLLASRGNVTSLSSLTFLTPMFAAAGGFIFLGETLTLQQLVGAGLTLGAVALISLNGKESQE